MQTNIIYNSDCLEGMKSLPSESVHFICPDVPYTDGKRDVLAGHKIHTKLDILAITKEHFRILKPNSFYAFFGQMPTILVWYNAAIEAGFEFRIDIVWAKKRGGQGGNLQIKRSHELIYIFSKGNPNYHKTNGVYSDVSQALVENNLMDIETIFRRLSEYEYYFRHGKERVFFNKKNAINDSYFLEKGGFKTTEKSERKAVSDTKQFNSIWAFATHNQSGFNKDEFNVKHPTVKPIPLMERLIELCTPEKLENGEQPIVLDSFIGSGTTALACLRTNRKFIGYEIDKSYFEIANERINKELAQSKLF